MPQRVQVAGTTHCGWEHRLLCGTGMRLIVSATTVLLLAGCPMGVCPVPSEVVCQSDSDCGGGLECRTPDDGRCVSSSCACTAAGLVCTRDCGGKVCQPRRTDAGVNDAGTKGGGQNLCAGFVPPCQSDSECGAGKACLPPENRVCAPSACACDAATGNIICTSDCSGRVCRAPSQDAGPNLCAGFEPPCSSDAQCGPGRACLREPNQCNPSFCGCDPATGGIFCTDDCGGGVCGAATLDAGVTDAGASDGGFCAGFVPPCSSDTQCGPGSQCVRDPNQCNPSACGCDPTDGTVFCTADCGGGVCAPVADAGTPDAGLCVGFEPPCSTDAECGPGKTCKPPASGCAPSACGCDPATGAVFCTADCGGKVCLP